MCGIIGAVSNSNVVSHLLQGLNQLEYRGYDSAGIAVINDRGSIARARALGRVKELDLLLKADPLVGHVGIAHTRWATHGAPSEKNAHPHICRDEVAVVHNGIIENHVELRTQQLAAGHVFSSQTDTEVIVHQIYDRLKQDKSLLAAVRDTVATLTGAYALGVVSVDDSKRIIAARRGSPLVIGLGDNGNFIASDVAAIIGETSRYLVLEDGDIADITGDQVTIYDSSGATVEREIHTSSLSAEAVELGDYRYYMEKEIFEQPQAVADTLEGRISAERVLEAAFGPKANSIFDQTRSVQIVACGTSYHAGLVAQYWFETFGVPCQIEVASEFRYRPHAVNDKCLLVTISQSGETADTLAALAYAAELGFAHSLTICNVAESSLVRASELSLMTHAGPEIGVASTKAFTTQLTALMLLVIALGRRFGLSNEMEARMVGELRSLPAKIEKALELDQQVAELAKQFGDKQHALFLGRGVQYPVAMEGALKLKEISYVHAEAYPAGELKHGPLALVDEAMPVVAVAPNNDLLEKLKSNLEEVRARGGKLIVFADPASGIPKNLLTDQLAVAAVDECIAPIIYTIPLQLLAFHVALIKGTDVDKPRNLAKSVTVE